MQRHEPSEGFMKNRNRQHYTSLTGGIVLAASLLPAIGFAADDTKAKPTPPAGGGIAQEKTVPVIVSGKWTGKRLPDGQPDISGDWSNTIANHNNFTDPQGRIPGEPDRPGVKRKELGPRAERAPSRVSDPVDGQLPLQDWALAKVKEFQIGFHNPVKQEHVEPLARCAPAGIPKSFYWHGYEIAQYPHYVVFFFNSGTRIIHLDGKPHLPSSIKLWNGDSRGHWEGNTLVVDVTNQNGKALLGRSGEFLSENARIEERYIFSPDGQRTISQTDGISKLRKRIVLKAITNTTNVFVLKIMVALD